jgi:hypothetical protein
VSADFPGVSSDQREKIYECLKGESWKKVMELGRDISTTWYASFKNEVSEASAISITISDFEKCSKTYCKPKLVIHWGPNKPTFDGLI